MPNKEIELKILAVDLPDIKKKLSALGAKEKPEILVSEKALDFPDRKIKQNGGLFRLRQRGDKTELTYKDNLSLAKGFLTHDEYEITVSDFAVMEQILRKLGFKCFKDREKKRTSFTLDKLHFEIDKYPDIPPYLEIEGSKDNIERIVKKLGYSMSETTNLTATQVLKKYRVNSNIQKFKK